MTSDDNHKPTDHKPVTEAAEGSGAEAQPPKSQPETKPPQAERESQRESRTETRSFESRALDSKSFATKPLESKEDDAADEKVVIADVGAPKNIGEAVYKTGKRKDAIARVWVKLGKGTITVNNKTMANYFARYTLQRIIVQPFALLKWEGKFDVKATIKGGGISGQAQALRFGISRALAEFGEKSHRVLRKTGYLTRDSRVVERKKYGLHKARRAHQFSKR